MFENVSTRPRRRGAIAVSVSLHLVLGGTVWVRPLLATQEPPEVPDRPIVFWELPKPEQPIDVTLLKAAPPKGGGGGGSPRPLAQRTWPARPAVVVPPSIPDAVPVPGSEEPPNDDRPTGEFREPIGPGEGDPRLPPGPRGEGPMSIGELGQRPDVTMPVPLATPDPIYPEVARRVHVQGRVVLEAVIATDGSIRDARVLQSDSPLLERAAVEAVLRWRYQPARIGARPVSVYLTVALTFTLRG